MAVGVDQHAHARRIAQSTRQFTHRGIDDRSGRTRCRMVNGRLGRSRFRRVRGCGFDCAQTASAEIESRAETKKALRMSAPCTGTNVPPVFTATFDCNVELYDREADERWC